MKRARLPGALSVLVCLSLAAQAADVQHLPLIVLEQSSLADRRPDLPVITVGALPKEAFDDFPARWRGVTDGDQPCWNTFPGTHHDTIDAIAGGKVKFAGPVAGRTVLLFAAPFLNVSQAWIPTALTLQDKTITLEVAAWDGNVAGGSEKNFSHRAAYLISLCALPQGDYAFHLRCTHLTLQPGRRYLPSETEDASAPFAIAADAAEKNLAPVTVPGSALKSEPIVKNDALPEFAPPDHWARADSKEVQKAPEFQVGNLDAYKYMDRFDRHGGPPPRPDTDPAAAYAADNFVALINPHISAGDFILLSSVEFHGEDIVINAECWQDRTPRAAAAAQSPFILIPIYFLPQGDHKITLNWRTYRTSKPQAPYAEFPPEGAFKPATITFTIK